MPPKGLNLEAVYVGLGTEADFAGRDVSGKAALITSMPMCGSWRHSATINGAIRRAEEHGAAAILVSVALPGNIRTRFYPTRTEPPTFSLGLEDSDRVRELIEQAQSGESPRVSVQLDVEMVEGLKTANVWGELPGATDEKIIIVSHRDGWFEGANDNASGVATAVVLAEYFASLPREQRRRTIQFVGSPGHHNSAAVGIQWMADNRNTVFDKTALLINAEHTGAVQTYLMGDSLDLDVSGPKHRTPHVTDHALVDGDVHPVRRPNHNDLVPGTKLGSVADRKRCGRRAENAHRHQVEVPVSFAYPSISLTAVGEMHRHAIVVRTEHVRIGDDEIFLDERAASDLAAAGQRDRRGTGKRCDLLRRQRGWRRRRRSIPFVGPCIGRYRSGLQGEGRRARHVLILVVAAS